jgi:hypothetical protein
MLLRLRYAKLPFFLSAALIALVIFVVSCNGDAARGPDLQILGPASRLGVGFADLEKPSIFTTQYSLSVKIANFTIDTEGGNVDSFGARCDILTSDSFGIDRFPVVALSVDSALSVVAFGTTEMSSMFSVPRSTSPIGGYFLISCTVDPQNRIAEADETNNSFNFLFNIYCNGSSIDCPGPVQQGGSVSCEQPDFPGTRTPCI